MSVADVTERDIPFPCTPYPQQRDLMKSILECVESSSVGCFESPTGTGKSLSVICATLYWQFEEEKRILQDQLTVGAKKDAGTSDNWLMAFQSSFVEDSSHTKSMKMSYDKHMAMIQRVKRTSGSYVRQRGHCTKRGISFQSPKKSTISADSRASGIEPEDEFSLKHYDSDEQKTSRKYDARRTNLGDDSDCDEDDEEDTTNILCLPKIFYCSRTHSQISQFSGEIKRTAFASARCVTLGSRKNMCINPDVNSAESDAKISEICLEMHKSKTAVKKDANLLDQRPTKKRTTGILPCPFHAKQKEMNFADHALGEIRDIESLTSLGKELEACPYYGTRKALKNAQVVCMPYNMLLLDDLRASMGIDLKHSVVIFDEAHNLVEAVNQIYSSVITSDDLTIAGRCMAEYRDRFQSVLTGKNFFYVNVLTSVIAGFENFLSSETKETAPMAGAKTSTPSSSSEVLSANELIFQCRLDNVNMLKLKRHVTETNLVEKVGGYADHAAKRRAAAAAELATATVSVSAKQSKKTFHYSAQQGAAEASKKADCGVCSASDQPCRKVSASIDFNSNLNAMRRITEMITCLANNDADGRIAVSRYQVSSNKDHQDMVSSFKFILLNPSVHFKKIVDESRSVILLGGTLQPFTYLRSFLYPHLTPDKLRMFSCGHVVSRSSVLTVVASKGPRGSALEFTHSTRMQSHCLQELYSSLTNISILVPNGIVVFFSSYQYMGAVIANWRTAGLYAELEKKCYLFVEPRLAADAESVWLQYSKRAVAKNEGEGKDSGCRGAMLFCVMGGKLSEGINFSDELARCVVVVGMPYPDGRDAVLQEKLKFANLIERDDKAGKRLYEAMCMRTVNQCIGRSIRHINDYAAIVLLDCRYAQSAVIAQLPAWLGKDVLPCSTFQEVESKLKAFFKARAQ